MAEKKADKKVLGKAKKVVGDIGLVCMLVAENRGKINDDTAREVLALFHEVAAECHWGIAELERIKTARDKQSTSKVGGGRRKSRK
jgi:hypothetical protein